MIVASGFVETNELNEIEAVINRLKERGVEVNDVKDEKITFLIERHTAFEVKKELESLRDIEGIKNVSLTYFSLEENEKKSLP